MVICDKYCKESKYPNLVNWVSIKIGYTAYTIRAHAELCEECTKLVVDGFNEIINQKELS